MFMSRGMYGLSAEEIDHLERRQANLDRDIKPRLGPKRRPPSSSWDSLTKADWERIRQQLFQVFGL